MAKMFYCFSAEWLGMFFAALFVLSCPPCEASLLTDCYKIKATSGGPIESLELATETVPLLQSVNPVYFLTQLKRENGNLLDSADNGKWNDIYFYLPYNAKPDKKGYKNFLAHTQDTKSIRMTAPLSPSASHKEAQIGQTVPTVSTSVVSETFSYHLRVGSVLILPGFRNAEGKVCPIESKRISGDENGAEFRINQDIEITGKRIGAVKYAVWPKGVQNFRRIIYLQIDAIPTPDPKWEHSIQTGRRGKDFLMLAAILIVLFLSITGGGGYLFFRYMKLSRRSVDPAQNESTFHITEEDSSYPYERPSRRQD